MAKRNQPVFTADEVGYALLLASQVNPDTVSTDAAKALIYKARSVVENRGDGAVWIGPFTVKGN